MTATGEMGAAAAGEMPATASHAVLGVRQSRCSRYRNAEQQRRSGPQKVSRTYFIHAHIPVLAPAILRPLAKSPA
jgi:hypothetical protein